MVLDGFYPIFPLALFLMIIAIAVVLGIVIIVIIAVLRATVSPARQTDDSALRILRERFARGEISEEEYEKARRTLER